MKGRKLVFCVVLLILFGYYQLLIGYLKSHIHKSKRLRHKNPPKKYSYVMYVSHPSYFKGALACMRMLKLQKTRYPFMLIHSIPIPSNMNFDCATRYLTDFPRKSHGYYRNVMLKLSIFLLEEFDKLVYVESDTLPLQNLDHLFDVELENGFAAPIQHWGDGVTDTLMILKPNKTKYNEMMRLDKGNVYDMDVINMYFTEFTRLPSSYGFLNGLLGDSYPKSVKGFHTELSCARDVFKFGNVIHFTSVGKPWSIKPQSVATHKK